MIRIAYSSDAVAFACTKTYFRVLSGALW